MKSQLNSVWLPGDGEVDLFRKMSVILSSFYKVSFIEEVHKKSVRFRSMTVAVEARREIADLWIIAYSPKRKKAKMTFLQAKYLRGHLGSPAVFSAEFFQYELLSQRLMLTRGGRLDLPHNVLDSSCCNSVGCYGVFYLDAADKLDLAYCSAKELTNLSPPPVAYGQHHINLQFPAALPSISGCNTCPTCKELNYSLEIDVFTKSLLNLDIGADIYHQISILAFVRSAAAKKAASDQTVQDFISFVNNIPEADNGEGIGGDDNTDDEGMPAHLLIINVDGLG